MLMLEATPCRTSMPPAAIFSLCFLPWSLLSPAKRAKGDGYKAGGDIGGDTGGDAEWEGVLAPGVHGL